MALLDGIFQRSTLNAYGDDREKRVLQRIALLVPSKKRQIEDILRRLDFVAPGTGAMTGTIHEMALDEAQELISALDGNPKTREAVMLAMRDSVSLPAPVVLDIEPGRTKRKSNFKGLSALLLKEGRYVMVQLPDGHRTPLPYAELPEENVIDMGPLPEFFFRPSTYMLYVFADSNEAERAKADWQRGDGTRPIPLFPHGTGNNAPINDIWRKAKKYEMWNGIVGVIRYEAPEKADWLYIDMMSVRPAFRRNKINARMWEYLLKQYPNRRVGISRKTPDGKKFAAWWESQGGKFDPTLK